MLRSTLLSWALLNFLNAKELNSAADGHGNADYAVSRRRDALHQLRVAVDGLAGKDVISHAGARRPGEAQRVRIKLIRGHLEGCLQIAAADIQDEVPPGVDVSDRQPPGIDFRVIPPYARIPQANGCSRSSGAACAAARADAGYKNIGQDNLIETDPVGIA